MNGNPWARLLAYVTGLVNQELLLENEYLAVAVSPADSPEVCPGGHSMPAALGGLLTYYYQEAA
jgi:hypothetical protein